MLIFGELFKFMKNEEILDRTLLIITSDHGENIGDHKLISHGLSAHDTLACMQIAKQDASLIYSYSPLSNSKRPVFIGLEIADSKWNLHPWEVCLITWPEEHGYKARVTSLDQRDVKLVENPPIFGRFLAVQWKETGLLQVILYWHENAIFKTNSSLENKIAKISLVAYSDNPEEYHEIEEYLLDFGKAVANYWQPIKAWSVFAVTIAQNM